MSGSGGSGGYELPPAVAFSCLSGTITTLLSSLNIALISKIKDGQIIPVSVNHDTLVLVIDGDIIGSIVHQYTKNVLDCIKLGHIYEAEIINLTPLTCRVVVRHA